MPNPPKLFISYSHDSPEHKKMVLDLANRFRTEQGIDCQIDQHFLPAFPPEGWMKWMRDQIDQADFVLMVCTPTYRDRYERNVETGGHGVAFEGLVISERLYEEYFKSLKFIPVTCDDGNIDHVSYELRGKNIYSVPSDFETLADLIKGKQYNPPPPLGEKPQEAKTTPKTVTQNNQFSLAEPASQREAELTYLNKLLQQRTASFATDAYITLSGDHKADRQLMPDDMMPISYRHKAHVVDEDKVHKAAGEATHCDDLINAFEQYQRLVILGEPGAGKTFSLWKIAAEKAAKALTNESEMIPVVVPLNKWTVEAQSLQDFVLKQMGDAAPFFQALTQQKRLLPLLDALNEIPFAQREAKLPLVKEWVKQDFPKLIISCRERDYTGSLVQDMDRLEIEPLDPPRVYAFLENYFKSLHQGSSKSKEMADNLFWRLAGGEAMRNAWQQWQENRPDWKIRLQSALGTRRYHASKTDRLKEIPTRLKQLWHPFTKPDWDNFWDKKQVEDWYWENRGYQGYETARETFFKDQRCLMKLAQNPYLLNLIIFIYRENEEQLPDSRYQLFDYFVTDLLRREVEDNNKAQAKSLIPDQNDLLTSLKRLAWQLQGQADEDEARTTVTRQEVLDNQTMTTDQIRFSAAASILEVTNDTVRFSHQLLQEYFTAQSFEERIASGLKASELWQADAWWKPNGWEEAAKLAADYEKDPNVLLHWLAEGNPRLAVEIAKDQNLLENKDKLFLDYRAHWQTAITDVESYPNPHERHAISTALAWLDWDVRTGIGINDSGLPDITWQDISKDEFSISRYPVTNYQFQSFVEAGGYENEQWWVGLKKPEGLPKHAWKEGNRPVERVDWYESIAFCRWLSTETGENIQLPTEQQWEKAASGSELNGYPWGNEYISGYANIDETWGEDIGEYNLQETSAVGIYPQAKSPQDVLDMSGNVWEWCLNKYEEADYITTDLSNDRRVVRGGSWYFSTEYCRSSFRYFGLPGYRYHDLGFRLVRIVSPSNDH